MQTPQEPRPRAKSPFVAAFLSFLFPGLGHAYVGAYARALAWATPPILLLALIGGIALRAGRLELLGFLVQTWVLTSVFVVNLLVLGYRLLAIVDAWRAANYANAWAVSGGGRLGAPKVRLQPLSVAGLVAVCLVMTGAHVAVARYDIQAMDFVRCVFDDTGTATCDDATATASPSAGATDEPLPTEDASASPSPLPSPVGTALASQAPLPPWDGKERLNVLLIGSDERPGESGKRTDTLIVASIDPATKRVAMFTLPRDTVDVPIPAGPARSLFGRVYAGKINAWYSAVANRPDLYPGTDKTRGYNGLKAILGELYGLDIRWFVEVNFEGFKKVVDTLGGVTINVQMPVSDDYYPGDDGRLRRIYIPAGIQHMSGEQALIYARSRHASSDFDRGARQQRILVSLREQTDVATVLPRIDSLIGALKSAIRTDIPVSELPKLLSLADGVDIKNIRSYVFAPSFWAEERRSGDPRGYVIVPRVERIRLAVKQAFTTDPAEEARREAISEEAARVWILNGSGVQGQATTVANYLEFQGFSVSTPNQRPEGAAPKTTRIVAYNGAETSFPTSIAYLESLYGVTATTAADPTMRADIVITTAGNTPTPAPPPAP
jgi:LCP family protein required for cell wall assembly